ncbi:MAG TPA: hypothetical protein VG455_16195, partial [Acidimicrobiales bacterium]|nr:hypothetical protein [Acidimicrobiales bacterium]
MALWASFALSAATVLLLLSAHPAGAQATDQTTDKPAPAAEPAATAEKAPTVEPAPPAENVAPSADAPVAEPKSEPAPVEAAPSGTVVQDTPATEGEPGTAATVDTTNTPTTTEGTPGSSKTSSSQGTPAQPVGLVQPANDGSNTEAVDVVAADATDTEPLVATPNGNLEVSTLPLAGVV